MKITSTFNSFQSGSFGGDYKFYETRKLLIAGNKQKKIMVGAKLT